MNKAYPYPIEIPSSYPGVSADNSSPMSMLSLQQIVRTVRRRLWMLALVVLSIFSAVAFITFQMTPIYMSSATVIVDQRQNNLLELGSVMSGLPTMPGALETELEILQSPVLLERVVSKLELQNVPEFNPRLVELSGLAKLKAQVKSSIKAILPFGDEKAGMTISRDMTQAEQAQADVITAVRILGKKVNASRVGRTLLFRITASSEDAELSANIANAVADQYLVDQLDAKFEATRRANSWLDERLSGLRAEVNAAESAVEAYRSQNGLLSARGQTLTEQQISDISSQLMNQEAEYSERRARLSSVRTQVSRGMGGDAIAEALNSEVVRNLRVQQAQIVRQRSDLETKYGPRHPDVIRIVQEERDLVAQIDAEIRRIVSSLESEVAISRERVDSLRASLSSLRDELSVNNRSLIRLRELERNADASRTLYEAFLSRFKETNEQESITEADARILSYAQAPDAPALPRRSLNLALGLLLGLATAGALMLLMELLDNRVGSGEEIEERFSVPFLGNVPLLPSGLGGAKVQPGRYLVTHPMSAFAESMRNLRASVKFANIDNPAKLVTITSSFPNEGKTSLSLSLGRMSAMTGSRTLVIDGDFRRQQLTETSGLKPELGLIEYLLGEAELGQVIHRDTETELDILPLTKTRNTSRDVFGSQAFDALMEKLKTEYDLIVVDTAPILLMAETRVIAAKSDQVVVTARWRRTSRGALAQTLGVLREFNANVAGVTLTFVDLKRLSKHSGAALSNYRAYSKYYVNN